MTRYVFFISSLTLRIAWSRPRPASTQTTIKSSASGRPKKMLSCRPFLTNQSTISGKKNITPANAAGIGNGVDVKAASQNHGTTADQKADRRGQPSSWPRKISGAFEPRKPRLIELHAGLADFFASSWAARASTARAKPFPAPCRDRSAWTLPSRQRDRSGGNSVRGIPPAAAQRAACCPAKKSSKPTTTAATVAPEEWPDCNTRRMNPKCSTCEDDSYQTRMLTILRMTSAPSSCITMPPMSIFLPSSSVNSSIR